MLEGARDAADVVNAISREFDCSGSALQVEGKEILSLRIEYIWLGFLSRCENRALSNKISGFTCN